MQEQDAEIGVGQIRGDQQRAVHVGMPARLGHQHPAQMVQPVARIPPLLQQRGALERRVAAGDDAHGLAASVHLDGRDAIDAVHGLRFRHLPFRCSTAGLAHRLRAR